MPGARRTLFFSQQCVVSSTCRLPWVSFLWPVSQVVSQQIAAQWDTSLDLIPLPFQGAPWRLSRPAAPCMWGPPELHRGGPSSSPSPRSLLPRPAAVSLTVSPPLPPSLLLILSCSNRFHSALFRCLLISPDWTLMKGEDQLCFLQAVKASESDCNM